MNGRQAQPPRENAAPEVADTARRRPRDAVRAVRLIGSIGLGVVLIALLGIMLGFGATARGTAAGPTSHAAIAAARPAPAATTAGIVK